MHSSSHYHYGNAPTAPLTQSERAQLAAEFSTALALNAAPTAVAAAGGNLHQINSTIVFATLRRLQIPLSATSQRICDERIAELSGVVRQPPVAPAAASAVGFSGSLLSPGGGAGTARRASHSGHHARSGSLSPSAALTAASGSPAAAMRRIGSVLGAGGGAMLSPGGGGSRALSHRNLLGAAAAGHTARHQQLSPLPTTPGPVEHESQRNNTNNAPRAQRLPTIVTLADVVDIAERLKGLHSQWVHQVYRAAMRSGAGRRFASDDVAEALAMIDATTTAADTGGEPGVRLRVLRDLLRSFNLLGGKSAAKSSGEVETSATESDVDAGSPLSASVAPMSPAATAADADSMAIDEFLASLQSSDFLAPALPPADEDELLFGDAAVKGVSGDAVVASSSLSPPSRAGSPEEKSAAADAAAAAAAFDITQVLRKVRRERRAREAAQQQLQRSMSMTTGSFVRPTGAAATSLSPRSTTPRAAATAAVSPVVAALPFSAMLRSQPAAVFSPPPPPHLMLSEVDVPKCPRALRLPGDVDSDSDDDGAAAASARRLSVRRLTARGLSSVRLLGSSCRNNGSGGGGGGGAVHHQSVSANRPPSSAGAEGAVADSHAAASPQPARSMQPKRLPSRAAKSGAREFSPGRASELGCALADHAALRNDAYVRKRRAFSDKVFQFR